MKLRYCDIDAGDVLIAVSISHSVNLVVNRNGGEITFLVLDSTWYTTGDVITEQWDSMLCVTHYWNVIREGKQMEHLGD